MLRLPLLHIFALVSLLSVGACDIRGSFEKHMREGKAALDKKNYNTAIIELKNAAGKNPSDAEARYLLGTAYTELGDFLTAEKELRNAKKLAFDSAKTDAALGKALLGLGKYREVLDEIQANPDYPHPILAEIFSLRGMAYLGITQISEARTHFLKAQDFAPQLASADLGLVQVLMAENKLSEAQVLNNQVLAKHANYAPAWALQGDLLVAQAQAAPAIAAYQKALALTPRYFVAQVKLASLFADTRQIENAQKQINELKKISPRHPLTNHLQARVYYMQRNYRAAEEAILSALKANAHYGPSLLLAGAIAHVQGSYEQAEKHLAQVLDEYPRHLYARKLLATTQLKMGQIQNALSTLKPLLDDKSPDPGALFLAGEAQMAAGEYSLANQYFAKAAALDPKNAAFRTSLGRSWLASGDAEKGLAELESATLLDPSHKADAVLIVTYLGKKEYDKALEAIAALEKKDPNNAITFNLKGGAYLGKKDWANARKSFERALAIQPTYFPAAVNLAQLDIKEKNPQAARKHFEAILAKDKNNLQAMLALADLALHSGLEQEYISWLNKAVAAHAGALQPRKLLTHYYLKKKDFPKALGRARQAQAANPKDLDALDLLGSAQLAAGEKDSAVATYRQLVASAPQSPVAYYKLAAAQAAAKDAVGAENSLRTALGLKADYVEAQVALAMLKLQGGQTNEALGIARQIQRQSGKSPLGFALEGDIFLQQKKYKEAAGAYEKAAAVRNYSALAVKLYQVQSLAGEAKKAEAGLQQWIKMHPDDVNARWQLAQGYLNSGKTKQAIEQYELILQKGSKNVLVMNNLAALYQQEKDPRALPLAESAFKLKPDSAILADTLGWILIEQGKNERGLELLQKAATLAPKNPQIAYHYAVALAKSGNKEKARERLEALLASGQAFPDKEQARTFLKNL